jgi:hypothetical protein
MTGAGLFWEKSTAGWLLVASLFWEKSTAGSEHGEICGTGIMDHTLFGGGGGLGYTI